MDKSPEIDAISAALAKAQAEITNPPKDKDVIVKTKTGGSYSFKYATMGQIIDTIRKPLTDNGLWFTQTLLDAEGKYKLQTTLIHSSGQWLASDTPLLVSETGNQAFGSALTYMRRYALSAMLGIAADDDDDGNAGDGHSTEPKNRSNSNLNGNGSRTKELAASGQADAKRDAAESDAKQIKRHIQTCTESQELDTFFAGIGYVTVGDIKPDTRLGKIKGVSATGYQHLVKLYAEKRAALENPQTQDRAA